MVEIDFTYFKAEIYIGQLSDIAVQENLNSFIEKYSKEYLNELLGNDYDYTADVYSVIDNEDIKQAIACFVYYYYVRSEYISNSGIGTNIGKSENSDRVKPISKLVFAWNQMVCKTQSFIDEVDSNDLKNPFELENQLEF